MSFCLIQVLDLGKVTMKVSVILLYDFVDHCLNNYCVLVVTKYISR